MSTLDFSEAEAELIAYCAGLGIDIDLSHANSDNAVAVQDTSKALKHFADKIAERAAITLENYKHYYELGRALERITEALHDQKVEISVREVK